MDNFRIKIQDFFNKKWRNSRKAREQLSLSANLFTLQVEYERVYGVKMSTSQICEMLICGELERAEKLPDYCGVYTNSNIVKLRCKYELVKINTETNSVELDENFNEIQEDDESYGDAINQGFNT